ncbi:MAG: DNA gyrase subunit A [Omnitrophica WOR_2 bacterium]
MEVGLVRSIDIDHEMQQAYLDYAMSVIVARALPDARDGLKPVHRRILYAMYDMGLRPESQHKKSARIVGEVLGKYHPHGDVAVYEAMARMAQDFSMRYVLVDGQGNFGSVDGDPPAAMRYTEARLAAPATNMLADIQKETVNFNDNFDGSLTEPEVLPASIPNLLVNGATGIAVGMSTSIPPHNLSEVVDALKYMLGRWDDLDEINVEDLMHFIQGPDFPTGGIIVEASIEDGLHSAYGSGRGKVVVQARAHIEEMSRGRNRIIVTELPYMTNKASLVERIAELVRDGRMEGIADLRDESDRHGMRIVIEVNKSAEPESVLRDLYKNTPMRSTFGIIMLALVDGEPRLLSLKQALRVYLEHRLVVIRRRSEYDLGKARQRAHILEGLRIALKNLDEVIDLIRKAPDVDTARVRLMKRFKLSEVQAQAILDMPLRRLAALERKKIEEEYKEVQALIKDLEGLLRSPKRMRQVAAEELSAVKEAFGDRRRTQIVHLEKGGTGNIPLLASDLTPERPVWISVTPGGLIARTLEDVPPRSSGREAPAWLVKVNTRDTLFLVSEQGEAAGLPVHAVPEVESPSDGAPVYKVSALSEQDKLAAVFTLPAKEERKEEGFVLSVTRQGMVKKTAIIELPGPTAKTFTLMKVNEGDSMGWVRLTEGKSDALLVTRDGMAIRFSEEEVRPMGLVAAGVGGIKLQKQDLLAGMEVVHPGEEVFLVASDGKAKRVAVEQFPRQGRFGSGVVVWKLSRTVTVAGVAAVLSRRSRSSAFALTLHFDKLAPKAVRFEDAPLQNRVAQGKSVADIKTGDHVLALTVPWDLSRSEAKALKDPEEGQPEKPRRQQKVVASNGRVKTQAAGEKTAAVDKKASTRRTAGPGTKKAAAAHTADKAAPAKPVSRVVAKKAASQPAAEKQVKTPAPGKMPAEKAGRAKSAAGKTPSQPEKAVKKSRSSQPKPAARKSVAKTDEPAKPAKSTARAKKPAAKINTTTTDRTGKQVSRSNPKPPRKPGVRKTK